MDVLTLLIMAAFYLLFFASIARYLRNRHPLELSVVLVFTSTAAIFAIAAINLVAPALAPYLSPVAVTMLVAQPALMLRLVGTIVPLPRWAALLVIVGFLVAVDRVLRHEPQHARRALPGRLLLRRRVRSRPPCWSPRAAGGWGSRELA